MSKAWSRNPKVVGALCLLLAAILCIPPAVANDDAPVIHSDDQTANNSNSRETLRALLQVQEQLHETQMAIEQARQESARAAARNAADLTNQLQRFEQALPGQPALDFETMPIATRYMLIAFGVFVAIGFLAVVFNVYFQWRIAGRLTELSAALPVVRGLSPPPAVGVLGSGENPRPAAGTIEQSTARLLGVVDRLERRIGDLECAADASPGQRPAAGNGQNVHPIESSRKASSGEPDQGAQVAGLLGTGESLLGLNKAQEAVACFEEALARDPNNTEALVKKGVALEALHKLEEAVACYDKAIALDGSMTIAYLHKGGLYNRMERFNEAMECYERALRTQEERRAG